MTERPATITPICQGAWTAAQGWRFAILLAVTNHGVLRRHLGIARTERLLVDIAEQVSALLPRARVEIAGRDLVAVSCNGRTREQLDEAIAKIEASFEAPATIDGDEYRIELVLGGAAAAAVHHDPVRLAEEAEHALTDARRERRSVTRLAATDDGGVDRVTLARDLHAAADRGELFLHYQPKLHVRRQAVTSIEALIRWRHPTRGLVMPGHFIPLAEETRDIVTLTLWTIRQVIADQQRLRRLGHDLTVFINIAGVLLADQRFVRQACALVLGSNARVGFEITETSVIHDPAAAIANLQVFADIGITIAIDDYGAGLSSLAYLKQLPARELKIDKLFITQLTSSHRDPLIVRSTIDLAHALEMEVVAEGVETPAALALLSVMGSDMVQGFLISRPIGLDALVPWLDEERYRATPPDPRQMLSRLSPVWRAA